MKFRAIGPSTGLIVSHGENVTEAQLKELARCQWFIDVDTKFTALSPTRYRVECKWFTMTIDRGLALVDNVTSANQFKIMNKMVRTLSAARFTELLS
jgi:hypothetical protein